MNIFKRLFKIGESEANAAIDNMEDPIKLTEQSIRDLKMDLSKNLESLAQVKALAIRANNDKENYENEAEEFHNKAILIVKKGQSGSLEVEESDRLAQEALVRKEEKLSLAKNAKLESEKIHGSVQELESNIAQLKSTISNWENELNTLKARVKVSKAKTSLNKQMAELDSSGSVAMLERMKEKVAQQEALADAYGDIAKNYKPIDDAIDKAADSSKENAKDALENLKKQLNQNKDA
jgi:phage shock protein A